MLVVMNRQATQEEIDGVVELTGVDNAMVFVVVLVLLAALGGIVSALISSGSDLLARAYGLGGREKEKKASSD